MNAPCRANALEKSKQVIGMDFCCRVILPNVRYMREYTNCTIYKITFVAFLNGIIISSLSNESNGE